MVGIISITPSANPAIKSPANLPIPYAISLSKPSPLFKNSSRDGKYVVNAPTATANVPTTAIKPIRPSIAVSPVNANGPIIANTVSKAVITVIISMSRFALAVAFSRPSIKYNTPTKATNGTAIANRATTPAIAPATTAPISVNGISNNVRTVVKATNAKVLDVAFSRLSIRANTPTNATNGTAIASNATTPSKAPATLPPTMLNGINTRAIAAANIDKAIAFFVAFSTFCIKYNTPTNAANGIAIANNDNTPVIAFPTFILSSITNAAVTASNNTLNPATFGRTLVGFISDSPQTTSANAATTRVKLSKVLPILTGFLIKLVAATNNAKTATTEVSATVAFFKLLLSINDNAITAPAINVIATVITIRTPSILSVFAKPVTAIRAANTNPRIVTTPNAL